MPEQSWKLGIDLDARDNLLDGVTFADLIRAVHCDCRDISPEAVRKELNTILSQRRQDMMFLLEINMDAIIQEARKGREL